MDQIYLEYTFSVNPAEPGNEILIAELGYAGFESFVENEEGVVAYIQKNEWTPDVLETVEIIKNESFKVNFTYKEIAQQNWNAEWEKNFHPIEVDGLCTVRAPFHEKPSTKYDIIIEPKMSFGTGHHETTHMMIQFLLKNNLQGKKVLDMGCGTGVLAILAEKEGATNIDAIDIDRWCFENAVENITRNNCEHIKVYEGDASLLNNKNYDVIIANINRNILLEDIPIYISCLNNDGILLLSGFYKDDIPKIKDRCEQFSLKFVENLEKNHWVAVKFIN
ncbi:50S ribosomal protein L11 methyltransferase [Galbibacter pacificus]|uniref:Ribosomal protein L11 methyltransferase n=1 Tax=Galbibacter pacificus TaxID=2996052 RepID=A0ABT6FVL2_9FLAO|nr:50S ribosomal protein L11 methyltransferase [Galbibacter pacificus]MDG3583772.1 50S ribosomal protein L11 methyltransferase [Galbibacter pacificus]MDG3587310.1 50S ribosomal protein L11 methyltransferase [Galbibacter pacificus]